MRMKKLMGVAVVLVGLAVALNALAFKTASVKNDATFTISATKDAALAIQAAQTAADTGFHTDGLNDGYLRLTITDPMQPNSTYLFSNVFQIANNATNGTISNIKYTAVVTGASVNLYQAGTKNSITTASALIKGGAALAVDMEVVVDSTVVVDPAVGTISKPFTIVISGDN